MRTDGFDGRKKILCKRSGGNFTGGGAGTATGAAAAVVTAAATFGAAAGADLLGTAGTETGAGAVFAAIISGGIIFLAPSACFAAALSAWVFFSQRVTAAATPTQTTSAKAKINCVRDDF